MKIYQIENRIKQLDLIIFSIKIDVNSNYTKIPYDKISELNNERNILKRKKYNLEKSLERVKKLNKINGI